MRSFPAVLSLVVLLAGLCVPAAPAAAGVLLGPICGDVNESGSLSATDALEVLKAAVGQPVKLQCPPLAAPLKTGVNTCSDSDAAPISCQGTGQDGEVQAGVVRAYQDNEDGTITDTSTGLMWEKLSNDGSTHDVAETFPWDSAFAKIFILNVDVFAGHDDWRLPNINELHTLAMVEAASPAIDPIFKTACPAGCTVLTCSCTAYAEYWSSTPYFGSAEAWVLHAGFGTTLSQNKLAEHSVRAVRSANVR